MRKYLIPTVLYILFTSTQYQCANPKPPQGGPQDTIPPKLIRAIPNSGKINFDSEEIILLFDERVNADQLKQKLIITPRINIEYKFVVKKDQLTLKFLEPFPDSTTITLNFFDGVTDVTERTPATNLSYVFSTGDYLDSLSITGTVKDLLTQKPEEKTTVGLYLLTDTLDIYTTEPTYFTTTGTDGKYAIRNIKDDTYLLLAFKDNNRNLIFNANSEAHAIFPDTISLSTSMEEINFSLNTLDASEPFVNNARPSGRYYIIQFSKPIERFISDSPLIYNITQDSSTVRFYKPEDMDYTDSTEVIFTYYDYLGNNNTDTTWVRFQESDRKPITFEQTIQGQLPLFPNDSLTIQFSKPVVQFYPDSISFIKDSLLRYQPIRYSYQWMEHDTKLSLSYSFDTIQYFNDQQVLFNNRYIQDTTLVDSLSPQVPPFRKDYSLSLEFPQGTFLSVENDTSTSISQNIKFLSAKETGQLTVNVSTVYSSYILEIIDKKYNTVTSQQSNADHTYLFTQLPAGTYGIRIFIDENEDGEWTDGNIRNFTAPEAVYIHPAFTELRANWYLSLDIAF
jgi:hypothetical protein